MVVERVGKRGIWTGRSLSLSLSDPTCRMSLSCRVCREEGLVISDVCLALFASYASARPMLTQHHRLRAHQVTDRSGKGLDSLVACDLGRCGIRLGDARDGLRVSGLSCWGRACLGLA